MDHDSAAHAAHVSAQEAAGWTGFFSQDWFMPHGHCYLWKPALLWLNAGSDTLIGIAYVGISLILWYLIRRVRLPFSPMIFAFGIFIGACGMTHFMEVWNVWNSDYWLGGVVKLLTAVASVATAAFLLPMRVRVVALANSAELAEARRLELEAKNVELEALYSQLKKMNELRTEFFANVSHELRTPLTLVIGPVERLLSDPRTDPACREGLETVQRNAAILLKQVNALLEVSRIEAGHTALELSEFDLAAMVRVFCSSFDTFARDRRIRFEVQTPERLPVRADAEKLERVALNLLSNAFKFVPEEGQIRVRLEREGQNVRLEVADSGPGIPVEWRSRVFERFQQVKSGDARPVGGTGLGLAICRDFVALHQGSIQVTDANLGGAQFEVLLPLPEAAGAVALDGARLSRKAREVLAEVEAPLADVATGELAAPLQPDRTQVLVVDDSPDMRAFVGATLRDEFEVHLARDGREGLVKAEALRPDVIVTDLMMPIMTGAELVTAVRQRRELDAVQIVLLTARSEEEVRVDLLMRGAQDFLAKPFSAQELKARVGGLARTAKAKKVLQRALASSSQEVDSLALSLEQRTRELELALTAAQAAREEAERASEVKSTFLSLMSHELRTPLTVIQLNIDSASRLYESTGAAVPAALTRVRSAARRLHGIVDSVFEMTRIEGGRLSLKFSEVNVTELVTEVTDELLPEAQRKLVRLTADLPEQIPSAETDGTLLRLILLNLVGNAVKFTDQGEVRVTARVEAGSHVLEVRDTGPGIPPEAQRRIYEPFVQLAEVRHKSTPGVGLGLALVRRMADALGATIELESETGQGTLFRLVLPSRRVR